jgi:Ni,Fe-hydrogenase III small subunit
LFRSIVNSLKPKISENFEFKSEDIEKLGLELKQSISKIFGKSLAIRVVDTGSDNSTEIEIVNLTTPYYDVERFGLTFVASPRHADVLLVTGAVTHNMEIALRKTYDATPSPKFVIAVGDDACGIGIFNNTYAVNGSVERIIPVDIKIPGNPPTPLEIIEGFFQLIDKIKKQNSK